MDVQGRVLDWVKWGWIEHSSSCVQESWIPAFPRGLGHVSWLPLETVPVENQCGCLMLLVHFLLSSSCSPHEYRVCLNTRAPQTGLGLFSTNIPLGLKRPSDGGNVSPYCFLVLYRFSLYFYF